MSYGSDTLRTIYDKTQGYCHLCHKKLSFTNYASYGSKGAWEVEHSRPKANSGTNHGNNLFAACVECNRSKGTATSRTTRKGNDQSRAPFSKEKVDGIRTKRTISGAVIGGTLGLIFGPVGAVIGSIGGAIIGDGTSPKK